MKHKTFSKRKTGYFCTEYDTLQRNQVKAKHKKEYLERNPNATEEKAEQYAEHVTPRLEAFCAQWKE